jgi:mono/diheme cytochrome c family protein
MEVLVRSWTFCLAAALFLPGPALAASFGDAANGKLLAERWCSSCHLVSSEQASATTEAPPFATIAERPTDELDKLGALITSPHPPMPQLDLSRDQIADLVAYIASLKEPE